MIISIKNFPKERFEIINYWLLLAIVATLPFGNIKINNLFVILLSVVWLSRFNINLRNSVFIVFLFFYFIHGLGLFYSANIQQGFFELEKKLSFVLFPIVLSGISLTRKQFHTILAFFAFSCFIASGVCIAYALFKLLAHGTYEFTYYSLIEIIGMHPTYFAVYVSFSIFITIHLYFQKEGKDFRFRKWAFLFVIVYFIVFLVLLSARVVIFSFCFIAFAGLLIHGYQKKRLIMAATTMGLLLSLIALIIYFNPQNRERFKEVINYKSQYSIDKQWGGRALRLLKWNCSLELIKENWYSGVGTGDSQDALDECYEEKKYSPLLFWENVRYNSHNQFLQSGVDLGIVGILALMLCLAVPAYKAVISRDYLLIVYIALVSLTCLTESILELNKGIVFFTLFISLFSISQENKKSVENAK